MKERDYIKKVLDDKVTSKAQIRHNALNFSPVNSRRQGKMKYRFALASALVIIIVMITTFAVYTPPNDTQTTPQNAEAYDNLLSVINKFNDMKSGYNVNELFTSFRSNDAISAPESAVDESAGSGDYSKTNIQNEGVEEGDIVKVDDNYIYKINTKGCVIISVDNGTMQIMAEIPVDNYVPHELYVIGNQLIMIGGIYEQFNYRGYYDIMPMYDYMGYISYTKTDIRIYDITNRNNPTLSRNITIDGSYTTSRIMEDTNELIYITNYYFSYGDEDKYIPKMYDSSSSSSEYAPMSVDNIYYYGDIANFSYSIIGKINLNNPSQDSEMSAFLGLYGEIYVSKNNIYVATYDYMSSYRTNIWGWVTYDHTIPPKTRIVKINIDTLTQTASTKVNGTLLSRYSMDEHEYSTGLYLRVATTVNSSETYNMVYVLKPDLTIAGTINNIAPGERIYSVRFRGVEGSLVTFQTVDPYFTLYLSDPYNPTISQGHKEDGVSHYIHYIGDSGYTIGVGRNAVVETTPWGEWARWKEIKVTLYQYDEVLGDYKDQINIYLPEQGDFYGYSALFYEPKALLYNEARGLFAFTFQAFSYNNSGYYNEVMYEGLAVFKIDLDNPDPDNRLIYRGLLSNLPTNGINLNNYYNDWNDYYNLYLSFIDRGVQIGDYIYTISDRYIVSYNINTLNQVDRLDIHNLE